MSTTTREYRAGDTDDVVATSRAHATMPRHSVFYRFFATDALAAGATARLVLGVVIFPHAAQHVLGWFGGQGYAATYGNFTSRLGLPGWLAAAAIITEFVGSILLILGLFTR